MSESQRERGERLFAEICGAPAAAGEGPFLDLTIDHIFGDVWAREDVSTRDRRLMTIAILSTLGELGSLEIHMRQALETGALTPESLQGAVVFIAHYAGWPRGAGAFATASKVIEAYEAAKRDGGS